MSETVHSKNTPPLVVLHGWVIDPFIEKKWHACIQTLERAGYEVVFLKLPGLTSEISEPWNVAHYCNWIAEQLKKFDEVVLIGHSFGGQLAVRYARLHSQQVKGLVLIDSSGVRDQRLQMRLKRMAFKTAAQLAGPLKKIPLFRWLVYKVVGEHDYYEAPPIMRETMVNVIHDEIWSDLVQIQLPTAVIWGEDDQVTPLVLGKLITQALAFAEFHVISGARHSPPYTHPVETAQLITRYLQQKVDAA